MDPTRKSPAENYWVCEGLQKFKPADFSEGADVVLVLVDDDCQELVAHSACLASQSKVLCSMFYSSGCKPDHPFQGRQVWRVPSENATFQQAESFLNYIYLQGEFEMTIGTVRDTVEILHRLDCTAALHKLDGFLTAEAGYKMAEPKQWVSPAVLCSACCF